MKMDNLLTGLLVWYVFSTYQEVQNNIFFEFDSIRVKGVDLAGPAVAFTIRMKCINHTRLSCQMDRMNATVFYLGQPLNPVTGASVPVNANATTYMDFHTSLNINQIQTVFGHSWKEVLANSSQFLHPSNYKLIGTVTLRYGNFIKEFDISKPFAITIT
jgi:hypothetical protein